MPIPFCCRFAACGVLLAVSACSFNPSERERPTMGAATNAADRQPSVASPLRNVRWTLREIGGQPAPATDQTPYLVLREGRARVEGRAGSNKFSGPYAATTPGGLRLGPLVTTRSACPNLAAEGAFLQALNQAQHYRISGNTLSLYAADTLGAPLARLAGVPEE